jgi:hypothetical protein
MNDDTSIQLYYKKFCKILTKVIKAAKKMEYDNHIKKSHKKWELPGKLLIWKQAEIRREIRLST